MNISDLSIKRPISTLMLVIAVMVLGVVSMSRLAIDLLPDVSFPIVAVFTQYEGAGPEEVERMITEPVEMTVSTINGVKEVSSSSKEGASTIIIEFNWGTNMDMAANDVRESLSLVSDFIPEEAGEPMVIKFDPSMMPVMMIRVSGDISRSELKRYAEDEIIYKIEQLDGVAMVSTMGGLDRIIHVKLNLSRMEALGVSADQIVSIVRMENLNLPSGSIKSGNREVVLRTVGEFRSIRQIENVIIASRRGVSVYLKDVAEVYDGYEEMEEELKMDGKPTVAMMIMKQSGSNTIQVSSRINKRLELIKKDLPEGLVLSPIFDSAEFIGQSVKQVKQAAMYGGFLAVMVLIIFLRNVRSTFIISLAIPVSIIGSFILLYFTGFNLNMMTLGGIALGIGMLVDNSIVVLENIYRHREKGENKQEAASSGTSEVRMAIVASTITTICVFLPILFVSGIAGMFFKNMAWAVTFSLVASLMVALTLIPMLSSKLLKTTRREKTDGGGGLKNRMLDKAEKIFDAIDNGYQKVIIWALEHRKTIVFGSFALLVFSLAMLPFARMEFMPEIDEGEIRATVKLPAGTKLDITRSVCDEVEKVIIDNVPEVEYTFVRSGSGSSMMSMMSGSGSNSGQVIAKLVDRKKRKRSTIEIIDDLRKKLAGRIPDTTVLFTDEESSHFMGMSGGAAIRINITGYDLAVGAEFANRVKDVVESVKGTKEVRVDREEGMPEYRFVIDRDKASGMGLNMIQIANAISTSVKGKVASRFRDAGHEYDIFVRLREEDRKTIEDIEGIMLTSMTGRQISLKNVVSIDESIGPLKINRKAQKRIITVLAGLAGKDLGSVVKEIRRKLKDVVVPEGFALEFGGQQEEMVKSFKDLGLAFLLAILLVYLVMASQFESLLDPFIIMFSVPLSLIGVVWMLFLTGSIFNVVVFIGVIMLAGIVVNNGIVLISYINILRERGMSVRDAVLEGGKTRLRPILMTTLTTILAMLPLAIGMGEGSELSSPIARAVIGGLIISSLLTLVFTPTLYAIFEERRKRRRGH